MSEFFVGQRVICIDADHAYPWHGLKIGQEYIIRDISEWKWAPGDISNGSHGIRIRGINRMNGARDVPLGQYRFRPLESKAISIFRLIAKDVTEGRKLEIVD